MTQQNSPSISLDIIYEDEWLFSINKPAWWVVHRGLADDKLTLVDVIKSQLGIQTAFPVHRLDRQTSGVLLFAKTASLAKQLQDCFETGTAAKQYFALVRGCPPPEGTINAAVPKKERGERVPAVTTFTRLETIATDPRDTSLVLVSPKTGRFHQIRRHLKHIHHPVIGDANYGKGPLNRAFRDNYGLKRMALHATALSIRHPMTDTEFRISAPLPEDLAAPLHRMGFQTKNV